MRLKLSEKGYQAWKKGLDGIPEECILLMEIACHLPRDATFTEENLHGMGLDLTTKYGSIEKAIEAIKGGLVTFTKVEQDDDDCE